MADMTPNEALLQAKLALDKALEIRKQNESFMQAIGPAIIGALSPMLKKIEEAVANISVEVKPNININPEVKIPPITIPDIIVPEAQVNVTVPEIKIPTIKIPKFEFPKDMELQGFMRLIGWDKSLLEAPLPVQIRDSKGRPIDFAALGGGQGGVMVEGNSGGGFQYPTIAGFLQSSFAELLNPDGRVKVSIDSASSGLTDAQLRAAHLDVQQTSGSVDSVNVVGFSASVATIPTNSEGVAYNGDNPLPVTFSAASVQPVSQVSGANWSVNVAGFTASVFSMPGNSEGVPYNSDNPLPVTFAAAASQPVTQVSGQAFSVYALNPVDQGDSATALRVVIAGNSDASVVVNNTVGVNQVSGAIFSTYLQNPSGPGDQATALRVTVAGDAVASVIINNPQGPGEQATALRVVTAGDSSNSVSVRDFNGNAPATGLNETGGGVLRVVLMTDSVSSVYVNNPVAQGDAATALRVVVAGNSDMSVVVNNPVNQGDAATALRVVIAGNSDASVYVNNPVNQGDVATALRVVVAGNSDMSVFSLGGTMSATVLTRSANPTAIANDLAPMAADKLARPITRPVQMRERISTAYATLTTGTETTLIAASAGEFLDAIMITGSNSSSNAIQVDIRAVTGGNIVHTMYIPALTGPVGWSPTVPYPQDNQGNAWTIDMGDFTNTTLYFTGLFSREI